MRVWIDCEFNSYLGELISIALVAESGSQFYASVGCSNPDPWVLENVIPNIGIDSCSMGKLQIELECWLMFYPSIHLVADWPEDIKHFCAALITGPGTRLKTPPLTMEVRRDLDAVSQIPHNALEDAKAMRFVHLSMEAI
jgi:hypothetical protein